MGLFDTIKVKASKAVICPGCQQGLTDFQTKSLDCMMDTYCEETRKRTQQTFYYDGAGKKVRQKGKPDYILIPHPEYHRFITWEWCENCEALLYQQFQFDEKGKLMRYGKPYFEEKK